MVFVSSVFKLIRPQQWVKNGFVLLPMFFGGQLLNAWSWAQAVLAFVVFSLMASAIYCLNDIRDADSDRKHPVKCKRPIPLGLVSIKTAWVVMLLLVAASECIAWLTLGDRGPAVAFVVSVYLVLNLAYCFGLKQIAIVDVFIISFGFVLRLIVGGLACNIILSPWIVLMTFLLTLFLAFAKRRDDVIIFENKGIVTRRNTQKYNISFLNNVLGILAAVTLVCYIMYTIQPEVIAQFNNRYIYVSSILVLAGIIRYLQISIVDAQSGSPTKILLHDRFIQGCGFLWILFFVIVIYCR